MSAEKGPLKTPAKQARETVRIMDPRRRAKIQRAVEQGWVENKSEAFRAALDDWDPTGGER